MVSFEKTKSVPKTTQIGKKGEEQAVLFLQNKAYSILASNWRHKHLEIDIIARHNKQLIIVEVKTRASADFGGPESFVTKSKQQKLIRAAQHYLEENNLDLEIRFDIIAITNNTQQIEHLEGAFYSTI